MPGEALPRLRQHALHLGGGTRTAEQIALRLRAAFPAQQVELRVGLDAFGRRDDAEALAKAGHRADDRHRIVARRQLADERTVDLDLVKGNCADSSATNSPFQNRRARS